MLNTKLIKVTSEANEEKTNVTQWSHKISNSLYYTGVGSRKLPKEAAFELRRYVIQLNMLEYTCRTGNAKGADNIFRDYANDCIAFHPNHVPPKDWTFNEVLKHMPNDRNGFEYWSTYVQNLLRRNMYQVLGFDGKSPSKFLICYAPSTYYDDSSAGGTGYAIRCALHHGIPVFNIFSKEQKDMLDEFLKTV